MTRGIKALPIFSRPVRWPRAGLPFDLRPLRFVLAAAEHNSFSAAARALDIRVSSISRGVREFEDAIGVSIFERAPGGVTLTKAGSQLINDIVPMLIKIEAVLENAGAAGRVENGSISIGIVTTLGGGFLRKLICAYSREFSGINMEIRDGSRFEHVHAIRSQKLDVAFLVGETPLIGCEVQQLWSERVHVALSSNHPLAKNIRLNWSQICTEHFIVPVLDPGSEIADYILSRIPDHGGQANVSRRPVSLETLLHMVSIGEGITLVSEGWTSMMFEDMKMLPLTDLDDVVSISAVWSPTNDNPALRRLMSMARSLAKNHKHLLS